MFLFVQLLYAPICSSINRSVSTSTLCYGICASPEPHCWHGQHKIQKTGQGKGQVCFWSFSYQPMAWTNCFLLPAGSSLLPIDKRDHSTDMIRQRAAENEPNREVNQHAGGPTIKGMHFMFSVDHFPSRKLILKPCRTLQKVQGLCSPGSPSNFQLWCIQHQNGGSGTCFSSYRILTPKCHLQCFIFHLFSMTLSVLMHTTPTLTTTMTYSKSYVLSGGRGIRGKLSAMCKSNYNLFISCLYKIWYYFLSDFMIPTWRLTISSKQLGWPTIPWLHSHEHRFH